MAIHHEILRARAETWLRPVARQCHRAGLTANHLTSVGLLVSVTAAPVAAAGFHAIAGVIYALGSSLDALDGVLARETQSTSGRGGFIDSVFDRVAEGSMFIGLIFYYASTADLACTTLAAVASLGGFCTSYIRAAASARGVECDEGWFTRFDRVVLLSVGLILGWLPVVIPLLALATVATSIQRFRAAIRKMQNP